MLKIVVTDYPFADLAVESSILAQVEHTLVASKMRQAPSFIAEYVRGADAVITQFASINAEVISAMDRAKVIVRYGVGVDNVDLAAARNKGIPVCNVPDYCVDEVADHALALILASTRQIVPNNSVIRDGKWDLAGDISSMRTLCHLTVGIIGFGRIGRAVVRRLLAFNARVIVFDPAVAETEITRAGADYARSLLNDLLPNCDIVSPHCPSMPSTRKMFDAKAFGQCRPGAVFVNVGRGDLVDSGALVSALESGKLSGAALDVFDPEPIPRESPLRKMPNVVLSAHVAALSSTSVRKLRESVAGTVVKALRGETLPNVVNAKVA